MLESDSDRIISRLKEALNAKSDGQLANYLGISRQNIGAARKREDVPTGWIYKVAELTGCSMDWLGFGKGPKIRADYTAEDTSYAGRVASPEHPYGFDGVSGKDDSGDLQSDTGSSGFVKLAFYFYSKRAKYLLTVF